MLKKLSKIFFSGFFALLPVLVTIWIISLIFSFADGILGSYIKQWTGVTIPGIGIIIILITSFLVGLISNYILGKEFLHLSEEILNKLPVINTIYASAKKVNQVLFMQKDKAISKRVCAVEYPRRGIWSIGFATAAGPTELKNKKRMKLTNVFIPNTPAPATGFTIVVPTRDVIFLNMSIEDALQLIITGGAVVK